MNMEKRKQNDKYEHYNIQGLLMQNLADKIFYTEERLSKSYEGKPRHYRVAKSWVLSLKNKIKALNLLYGKKKMKIIELNIKISEKLVGDNRFEEATDYLWSAFELIQNIYKENNLIFPKKTRSMSFKDFAASDIN